MRDQTNACGKRATLSVEPIRYRDFEDPSDNSRPPDAAIRANVEIIHEAVVGMGALMQACLARPALNQVVAGNTSSEARPPEKISGLNAASLPEAGALAAAGASPQKSEETEKKTAPQDDEPSDPAKKTPEKKHHTKPKNKPAHKHADKPSNETPKDAGEGNAIAAEPEGLGWLISLAKNFV